MQGSEDLLLSEPLVIRFQGGEADTGAIAIDDLLVSLGGWQEFIDLTASMFIQRQVTPTLVPPSDRPRLKITGLKAGTIEVSSVLEWAIKVGVGGVIAWVAVAGTKYAGQKLLAWIDKNYTHHIGKKRNTSVSLEDAARALDELARASDFQQPEGPSDASEAVVAIDNALKRAVAPVDRTVDTIDVKAQNLAIHVGRNEKRAVASGFYFSERDEEPFEAKVQIHELNLQTGHVSVKIIESEHPLFQDRASCYVKDRSFKKPKNPFARSLYEQKPMGVWVRPVFGRLTGIVEKWQLTLSAPVNHWALFSGHDGVGRAEHDLEAGE